MNSEDLACALKIVINTGEGFDSKLYLETIKRLDLHLDEAALPSKLKHYLSRRSYVKAYEYLKNPD